MEQDELLRQVVDTLERLDLPYLITGSMATILYGEPRFTNGIDVVVQLPANRIDALVECFPSEEFYLDSERIRQAVAARTQFNILHPASGLKIDIMIPAMDAFDRSRFARATLAHPADDSEATFAAPEDVIIKKMQFYAKGGSEKHLRDITGVLQVSGTEVDRDYVAEWADRLWLRAIWDQILAQV